MLFSKKYSTLHCDWIEQSVFFRLDAQEINNQFIEYSNNSFAGSQFNNQICICTDAQNYSCTIDELQPAYPGQQYSLGLIAKNVSSSIVNVRIDELPFTSCRTQTELMRIDIFRKAVLQLTTLLNLEIERVVNCIYEASRHHLSLLMGSILYIMESTNSI